MGKHKKQPAQGKAEQRFLRMELRADGADDAPKISGYAAVFDSQSQDLGFYEEVREEIDPHAFDAVLATTPDVCAFFNHDENLVLGRTTANTLHLSVDARGLSYVIDPPDTQFARDLMTSIRRGDINGSSFGFVCERDQWTENEDGSVTRRILEFASLIDVSPVTWPAYLATNTQARSLPPTMPAEMRSRFAAALEHRDGGDDDECDCDCPECQAGDCDDCSNPDCDDPNCTCADESRRLRIALELAELD
jgi:hypothetical protein